MRIEKVQIKNFGKFNDKSIEFHEGLNVIYGANESGKTTLHAFLMGMLFGIEKSRGRQVKEDTYSAYEPWNSASFYVGSMVMEVGGKRFFLERNFYHKEKTAKLRNIEDKEELSVEFGDLDMLLGGITKEGYENTYCIRQAGFLADASLAEALENYMADVSNSGDGSVRIQAAVQELLQKKRENEKHRKKLAAVREEKIVRLSMEAELLKKDITFQKNSELAEAINRNEEQQEKDNQAKGDSKKGFFYYIFYPLRLLFRWIGKGFLHLFSPMYERESETLVTEPELQESLIELKEQWREKENRYYNIEEQLQELSNVSYEEVELEDNAKALDMAMELMEKISTQIYDDISDELHEVVSKNLSHITGGKYDSIILDEALHLYIWENGKKIPVNQLSRGTLEQAYLAMRFAVGNILTKTESLPILLDETFSMYDDKRLKDTLKWILGYSGQILLFSCQKRELEVLDEMGIAYNKIILES